MRFYKTCRDVVAIVAAAFFAAAPVANAQQGAARAPQAAPPTPPVNRVAAGMGAAASSPGERLASALGQIGLTTCASATQRAANFLFEDGEGEFTVQPLGPDANRWPTVISIETAHATNGRTRFSTVTISPGQSCTGFYEQVITWPTPCDELARTVFAGFKSTRVLLKNVRVAELNAGLQLYLLPQPNGAGCTSIKRELFR